MFKYDINRPIYFKLSESGHEALNRFYGDQKSTFLTRTKEINGEVYYEENSRIHFDYFAFICLRILR